MADATTHAAGTHPLGVEDRKKSIMSGSPLLVHVVDANQKFSTVAYKVCALAGAGRSAARPARRARLTRSRIRAAM